MNGPIAGSAMPTTVESSVAMPEPSTAAAMTQRPRALLYASPSGVSFWLGAGAITPSGAGVLRAGYNGPPSRADR